MAIILDRSDRRATFYIPHPGGYKVAGALIDAGWVGTSQKWNPEDDLLSFRIPKDKTDEQFVTDLEKVCSDLDVDLNIEDHYYKGPGDA